MATKLACVLLTVAAICATIALCCNGAVSAMLSDRELGSARGGELLQCRCAKSGDCQYFCWRQGANSRKCLGTGSVTTCVIKNTDEYACGLNWNNPADCGDKFNWFSNNNCAGDPGDEFVDLVCRQVPQAAEGSSSCPEGPENIVVLVP